MTAQALYEIRDYHFEPERIDEYRDWAEEAAAVLGEGLLDLVGWWVDSGIPPRVQGADPMEPRHGYPNVTWIIRWDDLGQRDAGWSAMWEDEGWQECWARHPGPEGYLHMTSRFMHQV